MASRSEDLHQLAAQAWLFGYQLVLTDTTRTVMTAVPRPGAEVAQAPINQLWHQRRLPDHTCTEVVTPNADTLYTSAWLDLAEEPMVLSVPPMGRRYWMMQFLSAWTDVFAVPGSRTTGQDGGVFAVTGPGWAGELPDGVRQLACPTRHAWLIGRLAVSGPADLDEVHAAQDALHLAPLSAWRPKQDYRPPDDMPVPAGVDTRTPPDEQVAALPGWVFFTRLNRLMVADPPLPEDAPTLRRFAVLGIGPGARPSTSGPAEAAVEAATKAGGKLLDEVIRQAETDLVDGWATQRGLGNYGTDYARRALVARLGLGANLEADAICPQAVVDADGNPLTGAHRYRLRFAPGRVPPVHGFWSLSLYDGRQLFVDNPIHRYTIGDRDSLIVEPDGSLDVHLQHQPPVEGDANWLPTPTGPFSVFLRLYWPDVAALDGTWRPPPVIRID